MNLQFESLRAHIKSGAIYDDSPIIKNIVFDVERANVQIENENSKILIRLDKIKKELDRDTTFDDMTFEIDEYNECIDILSRELFDVYTYDRIQTDRQVDWKEYFHFLYDMIVVEIIEENMSTMILLNEIYKYWNTIEEPTMLEQADNLYGIVDSIRRKFGDLQDAHHKFTLGNIESRLTKKYFESVAIRKERQSLTKTLENNTRLLGMYGEILGWSIK